MTIVSGPTTDAERSRDVTLTMAIPKGPTKQPLFPPPPTMMTTETVAPWVAHTWYRMHGCVVNQGVKNVGRKSSWCRLNSEYYKTLDPFFTPS